MFIYKTISDPQTPQYQDYFLWVTMSSSNRGGKCFWSIPAQNSSSHYQPPTFLLIPPLLASLWKEQEWACVQFSISWTFQQPRLSGSWFPRRRRGHRTSKVRLWPLLHQANHRPTALCSQAEASWRRSPPWPPWPKLLLWSQRYLSMRRPLSPKLPCLNTKRDRGVLFYIVSKTARENSSPTYFSWCKSNANHWDPKRRI